MDAAEHRVDEPVEDLATDAGEEQVGDRRVVRQRRAREYEVGAGACQADGSDQARGEQGEQPLGYAEQRCRRKRTKRTARPDVGTGAGLARDLVLESEIVEEIAGRGHAHEQRVGAGVDGEGGDLAAEAIARLEHGHGRGVLLTQQAEGHRETRDPAADDDDVTLSDHVVTSARVFLQQSLSPSPRPHGRGSAGDPNHDGHA